jgi:hypothetical protein
MKQLKLAKQFINELGGATGTKQKSETAKDYEARINQKIDFQKSEWFREQTLRWVRLVDKGCLFAKPPELSGFIGLRMKYGEREFIFYVDENQFEKEIHTQILEFCERTLKKS